jgi:hypothetical protein
MKQAFLVLLAFFSLFPSVQAKEKKSFSTLNFTPPSLCGESLSSSYLEVLSAAGNYTFNVTAPTGCTYSITSNAVSWLAVTSPTTATGNSTVTFSVADNPQLFTPRVDVIVVGGKTFTVNQSRAGGSGARRVALDFNGDRVGDFVAIQNSNGNMLWWSYQYHIVTGAITSAVSFGLFNEDTPVPNDFDGDLKTDFAVWRGGATANAQANFWVLQSRTNTIKVVPFGLFGDNPNITQDFDGDFKADYAVTRKQNGKLIWYILLSATNRVFVQQFGNETDKPIRGDYDGDFRADLAVYRPNTDTPANTFIVQRSSNDSLIFLTFGLSDIDRIVPADYNGDNRTDFAVWRTTTGDWFWTSDGVNVTQFRFGQPGDLPVPNDYGDDNRADFAVWRGNATQGVFLLQNSGGFPVPNVFWGNSSMKIPAYLMQTQ